MKQKLMLTFSALLLCFIGFSQNTVKVLTSKLDLDTCQWNINKDSIAIILENMTPLAGETHHCCYNYEHCAITGEVIYNGTKYMYELNAGGWAQLVSSDYKVQFLLACTVKKYFKYFLSTYDPPDK